MIYIKRSIYSLALMDAVVDAVDRRAEQLHTSRSNLVNQILAEYLQCETPEMRIQGILNEMQSQLERHAHLTERFRMLEQSSSRMLALQSDVPYPYRPTAQYTVEIFRIRKNGEDGRLRVQIRTRNQNLLQTLDQFFRIWILWERTYLPGERSYYLDAGRFERSLHAPETGAFGEMVTEYVRCLDACLKAYLQEESGLEQWFIENVAAKLQQI